MTDAKKASVLLAATVAGLGLTVWMGTRPITERDATGRVLYVVDKATVSVPAEAPLDANLGLVPVVFQALPGKRLANHLGAAKGYDYLAGSACVPLFADGGPDESALDAVLPPGTVRVREPLIVIRPCTHSDAKMSAYAQERSDSKGAPFLCACSTGANCISNGLVATVGQTLSAGTWTGTGCIPKVCVEIAGSSSWPDGCPLKP